jgi:FkbH-like protein
MSDSSSMRVALLTSFTADHIQRELRLTGRTAGIEIAVFLGAYNQYAQQILDPGSALYASSPQLVILFIDVRALLGDLFLHPYQLTDDARRAWVTDTVARFQSFVDALVAHSDATVLLHSLALPHHSPYGILESKQPFGFVESIESVNSALRDFSKTTPRVHLFDYNAFIARHGVAQVFDPKLYYMGDIKVHPRVVPSLCRSYVAYLKPMLQMTKKCLVLDLDNTLWGGVVGEDGVHGIALGPTPAGRSYWEFQQYILSLFHRGVILAVNSKNNHDDAMEVFRTHPYMVLREEHFAAMQINWNDKFANMRALAEEINIGIDSMVFVDDDPMQRDRMRKVLPAVNVVDLPRDPAQYVQTLMDLDAFDALSVTEEDARRGSMYGQERQRREFVAQATDLETYLRYLQMRVTMVPADASTIPRIAQLTQKTNQFNMTTRRYDESDIARFVERADHRVYAIEASDTFGEYGIIGVALLATAADTWRIDTFLLSCRVIGRSIEDALVAHMVSEATRAGAAMLVGEFIQTKKNVPARDFYKRLGFALAEATDSCEQWCLVLPSDAITIPDFIDFRIDI